MAVVVVWPSGGSDALRFAEVERERAGVRAGVLGTGMDAAESRLVAPEVDRGILAAEGLPSFSSCLTESPGRVRGLADVPLGPGVPATSVASVAMLEATGALLLPFEAGKRCLGSVVWVGGDPEGGSLG